MVRTAVKFLEMPAHFDLDLVGIERERFFIICRDDIHLT